MSKRSFLRHRRCTSSTPDSDDGAVLDVWTVRSWRGEPINLAHDEHDELRWVTAHDLPTLDLAHAAYLEFLPGLLTTTR